MNPTDRAFHRQLSSLIKEVGVFIRQQLKGFSAEMIEYKGKNNLVSYVDKEAERMLVEGCRALIPGSGFINEETGESVTDSAYRWIIDPLDGTTNFIHGLDCFAISVALQHREETILGYVYHVPNKEMFSAVKGKGAYLNGKKIKVSPAPKLEKALFATGFPYTQFGWIDEYMEVLKSIMRQSHGLRRMGSAAIDLVYVACGRFDGFFEFKLSPWDVAAGALIVQEAGGKVTDFKGGDDYLFGRQILATNGKVHPEALQLIMAARKLVEAAK